MPRSRTIGMNTGRVIIIMLTWSTKMPRKMSSAIIASRMKNGERPRPVTAETQRPVERGHCDGGGCAQRRRLGRRGKPARHRPHHHRKDADQRDDVEEE